MLFKWLNGTWFPMFSPWSASTHHRSSWNHRHREIMVLQLLLNLGISCAQSVGLVKVLCEADYRLHLGICLNQNAAFLNKLPAELHLLIVQPTILSIELRQLPLSIGGIDFGHMKPFSRIRDAICSPFWSCFLISIRSLAFWASIAVFWALSICLFFSAFQKKGRIRGSWCECNICSSWSGRRSWRSE